MALDIPSYDCSCASSVYILHPWRTTMTDARPFPLNAWYAAAWSHEIKHELAARTVCNKDMVLYRRSGGEVAALEDACWHRLLPLSMGHLKGHEVVCGYHGLVFNAAGRCTYMPAQKTINPSACVRAYPVAERHRLVWIWAGRTEEHKSELPSRQ